MLLEGDELCGQNGFYSLTFVVKTMRLTILMEGKGLTEPGSKKPAMKPYRKYNLKQLGEDHLWDPSGFSPMHKD